MTITDLLRSDPRRLAHEQPDGGLPFVGRRSELEGLDADLERAAAGEPRLVIIEGRAGIGKTALAERFLASHPGLRVVRAGADEFDMLVRWGVADQLLRGLGEGHDEPLEIVGDHALVGRRLLDGLTRLQAAGPVAVVVDDLHWSDVGSVEALLFALRRLLGRRVLTVVMARDDESHVPDALRRIAVGASGTTMRLEGLSAEDLRACSGGMLTLRAAQQLERHTLGNPLHAGALLREAPAAVWSDSERLLPAPRAVRTVIEGALELCGAEARRLAEAAAILGRRASRHEVAAVAGIEDPSCGLDAARAAGLLMLIEERGALMVDFPDPLVHAAVRDSLPATRSSELHAEAARLSRDEVAVARHRARAATGPDRRLADLLDQVGESAARRGAWADAAGSLVDAARLSVDASTGRRRLLRAVHAMLHGGDVGRARTYAREVATSPPDPLKDALLALITLAERPGEAERMLEAAWSDCDARQDPTAAANVALDSAVRALVGLRGRDAITWSRRAIAISRPGDPCSISAYGALGLGHAHVDELAEGLAALDAGLDTARRGGGDEGTPLRTFRGWLHLIDDDVDRARTELREAAVSADRVGSFDVAVLALSQLARAEYAAGAWDAASAHAFEASSLADRVEGLWVAPFALWASVAVPASRGNQTLVTEIERAAEGLDDGTEVQRVVAALTRAEAAAARDDHEAVLAALAVLVDPATDRAVDVPGMWRWADRYAEALVGLQRLEEADPFLRIHEQRAAKAGRPTPIALLARVRGRLESARGDHVAAEAAFRLGLAQAERADAPFELALLQLTHAQSLRRAGQRRAAAIQLAPARDAFVRLGAKPSLDRCEAELAACGAPGARRAKVAYGDELTPQETAVATRVAAGMTNRQVAAELFISVKTVEVHLTRVYAKVGVASRAQLAARRRADDALRLAG